MNFDKNPNPAKQYCLSGRGGDGGLQSGWGGGLGAMVNTERNGLLIHPSRPKIQWSRKKV